MSQNKPWRSVLNRDLSVSKEDFATALRAHHADVDATRSPQRDATEKAMATPHLNVWQRQLKWVMWMRNTYCLLSWEGREKAFSRWIKSLIVSTVHLQPSSSAAEKVKLSDSFSKNLVILADYITKHFNDKHHIVVQYLHKPNSLLLLCLEGVFETLKMDMLRITHLHVYQYKSTSLNHQNECITVMIALSCSSLISSQYLYADVLCLFCIAFIRLLQLNWVKELHPWK